MSGANALTRLNRLDIACVRIVAPKFFGLTDLRILLPLMIVLGLVGPLVVFEITVPLERDRWFGLGRS